jgi:sn-glycerol 3-phosphate transport system substrate-binding protein
MRTSRKRLVAVITGAIVLGTLALPATSAGAAARRGKLPKCPLSALDKADKPVEIEFWTATNAANSDALDRITAQFNSSQSDVAVTIINQTTYDDALNKYIAGLGTGDLPDVVMIEDTGLQQMIDTQSILPAAACVKADDYDLSSHIERVVSYYTVDGTLYPMPFNVSNPVFLYNKLAFEEAGLDPDAPPETLDEIKEAAQTIVDAGITNSGFSLKLDPWYLEQFLAKAGEPFVNNGNGRDSRATEAEFDVKAGVEIFTWMQDMVDSDLAVTNDADNFDNLFAIGEDNAAMTIDTSASLGSIIAVLSGGQYPNVEIGVAPMPGPEGKGGVLVGGAALYISNKSSPAEQAAAWEYLKFLNTPDVQADWAASTGYIPIVEGATETQIIQDLWTESPFFKVAYDQLLSGAENEATAGPVIGDYQGVRDSVLEGLESLLTQGTKPKAALKNAKADADSKIQEYNSRVGA